MKEFKVVLLDGKIAEYHGKCGYVFHTRSGKCSEPCPKLDCKFRERLVVAVEENQKHEETQ